MEHKSGKNNSFHEVCEGTSVVDIAHKLFYNINIYLICGSYNKKKIDHVQFEFPEYAGIQEQALYSKKCRNNDQNRPWKFQLGAVYHYAVDKGKNTYSTESIDLISDLAFGQHMNDLDYDRFKNDINNKVKYDPCVRH